MTVLRATVTPTGSFAFDLALRYLRSSPSTIVERVDETTYARPIRTPNGWGLVRVRRAPGARPLRLAIEIEAARAKSVDLEAAIHFVRRTFQTDVDARAFARAIRRDPVLAAIVRRHPGLRPIQIGEPFETIMWAIIGQQINTTFAAKLKRALLERHGGTLRIGGATYRTFPEPAVIARLSRSDLRPLQFSRQKADYMVGVARAIIEHGLDLDALAALPAEQAIERLVQLPGVGRWTAEYLLMRGLGFPDVIPAADGGLRKVMGLAYGLGRNATEDEVRGIAERWNGWRSFGAFYWWFALQQGLVTRSIPTG